MKRLIVGFAFMMACLFPTVSFAEEEHEILQSGDYEYYINDEGTVTVAGWNGKEEILEIPGEIEGIKVTEIGDKAFSECGNLRSVEFPESIEAFGVTPFLFCDNITQIKVSPKNDTFAVIDNVLFNKTEKSVIYYPRGLSSDVYTIPDGILKIGDGAFFLCTNLTNIEIPDSVTEIGDQAFFDCENLTGIEISEAVTEIGERAFTLCKNLTSIEIPASTVKIGESAFSGCENLASVKLSDSLIEIEDNAFANCCNLTSIKIPASVESIGNRVFASCDSLKQLSVSPDNENYTAIDNVLFDKDEKTIICYPGGLSSGEYTIPDGIQVIGYGAFSNCINLTGIKIPDSVTDIETFAFSYCKNLNEVEIPDSVKTIDTFAFSDCSNLTVITLPDSLTKIGYGTFFGCGSLKEIELPDTLTEIEDRAFAGCSELTEIRIPDSTTEIGEYTFKSCNQLTLTVGRDSYAEQYAEKNDISYIYPDSNDWLTNE